MAARAGEPVSAEEAARRVSDTVDLLRDEEVDFLQEIVRIPTENPPGSHYTECARAIGAKMKAEGLEVHYVNVPRDRLDELAPQGRGRPRPNVVGTWPGRRRRPLLHFTGHYDVVPAGDGWSVDPFGGEVRSGNIYGRGTSDQKSGIAAQIFAIKALRRAGLELEGTVMSSATADEETGGFAGVGFLVERGFFSPGTTDYCVITECLDVDRVCIGHRGTMWLELETRGRQSHGSMPSEGLNAIEHMLRILDTVRREIMPGLEAESRYPVTPPACRRSTLAITMINAGHKINVVPALCRAGLDWRLIPEQSVAEVRGSLEALCARVSDAHPGLTCAVHEIMSTEPTLVSVDQEVVRAFRDAGEVFLGKPPELSVSPGSFDQKFIVRGAGLAQCIAYGPGPLVLAHQANEHQPVADLVTATKVMALAAWKLAGQARPG